MTEDLDSQTAKILGWTRTKDFLGRPAWNTGEMVTTTYGPTPKLIPVVNWRPSLNWDGLVGPNGLAYRVGRMLQYPESKDGDLTWGWEIASRSGKYRASITNSHGKQYGDEVEYHELPRSFCEVFIRSAGLVE